MDWIHLPAMLDTELQRMAGLVVVGGVEVFEEQMLGDQGVSAPRGS